MCGIAGAVNTGGLQRDWLSDACSLLVHRGPDDQGAWHSGDGHVAFAHQRLAIVDLSTAAHQPMTTPDGSLAIVFNGEIYNFRDLRSELTALGHTFRSQSDTEVILEAYKEWGVDCVTRFNGMFAFGLYDTERGRIFLARDRAGEKPLFYSIRGTNLTFASELKALLSDPTVERIVDWEALDCFLTFGFVPGDRCIIRGMRKLPPAHALTFDVRTGQCHVWRYWELPEFDSAAEVDESLLLEELSDLLENAVRRQLAADVPVGVLLSGGVDSSLITALAIRSQPNLRTFTVRFPGYDAFDETEHARLIARRFGTDHIELEGTDPSITTLPLMARQVDEPIADSSMIPTYLVSKATREHCKVALGGDGGDELFGGYHHYRRLLRLQAHIAGVPQVLRRKLADFATTALPLGFKGRNWMQAAGADLEGGLPHIGALFDRNSRLALMSKYDGWATVGEEVWHRRVPQTAGLVQRATRMDFQNFLPDDVLAKVDRASMLTSLEVRAPFLDFRIIEFAFRKVPSNLKATSREGKILLKRLASKLLPRAFDKRRKQGFSIPLAAWLRRGPWRAYFIEVLCDDSAVFDKRVIDTLLRAASRGQSKPERLYGLVMFELWRREFQVRI